MSALFRPWPNHGSLPDSATQRSALTPNTVPTASSEAMFRRDPSAGFQQARLSARVNRSVLFFVIAVSQNLSIQLWVYYT